MPRRFGGRDASGRGADGEGASPRLVRVLATIPGHVQRDALEPTCLR